MARIEADARDLMGEELMRLCDRKAIRRIVDAGAGAAAERMRADTLAAGHGAPGISRRATGAMLAAVGPNEYREVLGGGRMDVYPQGTDARGVRNATKAYVLNYGRGGVRRGRGLGDKFITRNEARTEAAVDDAMQAEADRIADEIIQA